MHGLINRSIQCFLRDTYGDALWTLVGREAGLDGNGFEALLTYEPQITENVIQAAMRALIRPRDVLLEDLGTYLVSHPNLEALRRLLRFGGEHFVDFLQSFEDLPERGRLALPDLDLPAFALLDQGDGCFSLACSVMFPGIGHVFVGLLRTMADDYGALVVLEHMGVDGVNELISIRLLDHRFTEGRSFDLAMQAH